ncbi:unnamed protein product [Adineta steineri]|uniref:Uncharacterized protein n=2 Tax=Adineta steineri TaxID=433720 RepID=A0A814R4K2_9BILA|nr:unnamed protein product [Adineta steineri]
MIFSYIPFLLFFIYINANEQYEIGIINHQTKWHIHCLQNDTRIINPPLNEQALIPYQCSYSTLSIDIIPIEIDFTFVCRLQPRLIWIIIDLYQYNILPISINSEQLNISLVINQEIQIKDYKYEINKYKNRFILINAFYIPFESLDNLLNKSIDIFVQINQCRFYINENSTWNDIIHNKCNTIESKTLNVQSAQCDFFSKSKPTETIVNQKIEQFDDDDNDNTTNIPDFHVILSIDQQKPIETTTQLYDNYSLFDEHYRKIISIIGRAANLITYIFIFTTIILTLLIIFFIYILCYHYHIRLIRKASLTI